MAKVKKRTCVYCGTVGEMTGDHIPPRSLYSVAERARIQMHKVQACFKCNNGASADDELFKLVVLYEAAAERPDEAALIDTMASTIGKNQKLAAQLFGSMKTENTPQGAMVSAEFDGAAYSRVVERIARALYFVEKAAPVSSDAAVVARPAHAVEQTGAVTAVSAAAPKYLNGGLFSYRVVWELDGASVWKMEFFGKHTAYALITPSLGSPEQAAAPAAT